MDVPKESWSEKHYPTSIVCLHLAIPAFQETVQNLCHLNDYLDKCPQPFPRILVCNLNSMFHFKTLSTKQQYIQKTEVFIIRNYVLAFQYIEILFHIIAQYSHTVYIVNIWIVVSCIKEYVLWKEYTFAMQVRGTLTCSAFIVVQILTVTVNV